MFCFRGFNGWRFPRQNVGVVTFFQSRTFHAQMLNTKNKSLVEVRVLMDVAYKDNILWKDMLPIALKASTHDSLFEHRFWEKFWSHSETIEEAQSRIHNAWVIICLARYCRKFPFSPHCLTLRRMASEFYSSLEKSSNFHFTDGKIWSALYSSLLGFDARKAFALLNRAFRSPGCSWTAPDLACVCRSSFHFLMRMGEKSSQERWRAENLTEDEILMRVVDQLGSIVSHQNLMSAENKFDGLYESEFSLLKLLMGKLSALRQKNVLLESEEYQKLMQGIFDEVFRERFFAWLITRRTAEEILMGSSSFMRFLVCVFDGESSQSHKEEAAEFAHQIFKRLSQKQLHQKNAVGDKWAIVRSYFESVNTLSTLSSSPFSPSLSVSPSLLASRFFSHGLFLLSMRTPQEGEKGERRRGKGRGEERGRERRGEEKNIFPIMAKSATHLLRCDALRLLEKSSLFLLNEELLRTLRRDGKFGADGFLMSNFLCVLVSSFERSCVSESDSLFLMRSLLEETLRTTRASSRNGDVKNLITFSFICCSASLSRFVSLLSILSFDSLSRLHQILVEDDNPVVRPGRVSDAVEFLTTLGFHEQPIAANYTSLLRTKGDGELDITR